MEHSFVILGIADSTFAAAVARRLEERGRHAAVLDLTAPWRDGAVTVRSDGVLWQGVDLLSAAAVLVERPVFAWPQPQRLGDLVADGKPDAARVLAERERLSLIASAVPAAAQNGRVINPPLAAHLASSPATALDLMEQAGLPVHPWRMAPAAEGASSLLDAAGRDLWHEPGPPAPGDPAIALEPLSGEVLALLATPARPLGALRFEDAPRWIAGGDAVTLLPERVPGPAAELACRAVGAVGLRFAAVAVAERGDSRLLWLDAGPDLAWWDERLAGRIAAGLADELLSVAAGQEGRRP